MARGQRTEDWAKELGSRDVPQLSIIPHIPVLLEDVPGYMLKILENTDYIPDIQTIGRYIPQENSRTTALLRTYTSDKFTEIKLDLSFVLSSNRYRKKKDTMMLISKLQNNSVVKIYGTLRREHNDITLLVDLIIKVENAGPMLKILKTMSTLARQRVSQYTTNVKLGLTSRLDTDNYFDSDNENCTGDSNNTSSDEDEEDRLQAGVAPKPQTEPERILVANLFVKKKLQIADNNNNASTSGTSTERNKEIQGANYFKKKCNRTKKPEKHNKDNDCVILQDEACSLPIPREDHDDDNDDCVIIAEIKKDNNNFT